MNRSCRFLRTLGVCFLGLLPLIELEVTGMEKPVEIFEARVFTNDKGESLPYRLFKPAGFESREDGTSYPLVLFFHGAGERGSDNRAQLVHGMKDFASEAVQDKYPCFVVAPQCPTGQQWVDTPWTAESHTMPEKPTSAMRLSLELLDQLRRELPVDDQRLYVTGLSMGGFGVWDAVQRRPQLFAAAMPICGGGDAELAERVKDVPLWVFHGAKDGVVIPKRSRDMVAAVREAGGEVKYTEYPEAGHNSWAATYANPEVYQWLFEQRRAVIEPPPELKDAWNLDPFYQKYVSAEGLPVLASDRVLDEALLEAAFLIRKMLAGKPAIRDEMIRQKTRFAVMATTEFTTQIPEHRDLTPAKFWDRRARGLGATKVRPTVSCGEENLLCIDGDPYAAENILIHEFAHAMHQMGLEQVDPTFNERLQAAFDRATAAGLWKGKYAANNRNEYWAEGVQSWFDTNRPPDHDHNHVDTRAELKEYDPGLAELVAEVFGDDAWRYRRPADRPEADRAHLARLAADLDLEFSWPPELLAWYEEYQRRQESEQ